MILLLLSELIGPCPCYLYLEILGSMVFGYHLGDTALDLSCQPVSVSKLFLRLLALDLGYEALVCLSAVDHACTGIVDCDCHLRCFVSWLMIWENVLLAGERHDKCFVGVDLRLQSSLYTLVKARFEA